MKENVSVYIPEEEIKKKVKELGKKIDVSSDVTE